MSSNDPISFPPIDEKHPLQEVGDVIVECRIASVLDG
jgi:hypothetical protein